MSVFGCDSILQLNLRTLVADTIRVDTTLCSSEVPFFWNGKMIVDSTGVYEYGVPSSIGCDSLYFILDLTVLETLVMKIDNLPIEICEDDDMFEVDYRVLEGLVSGYSVRFLDKAKNEGFEDVEVLFEDGEGVEKGASGVIEMTMPEGVRPDKYEAMLTFYNQDCGNSEVSLPFDVLYSTEVIAQRWNDLLAVKNKDYNGGYEFVSYQWFLNGQPIEGEIGTQLYVGAENLDFNGVYQVLLTRKDDMVPAFTCGLTPREFSAQELANTGVVIFSKDDVVIAEVRGLAQARVYDLSGMLCATFALTEGENHINTELQSGLYIVQIEYADGDVVLEKLIIK
jgi:hypothetical protein